MHTLVMRLIKIRGNPMKKQTALALLALLAITVIAGCATKNRTHTIITTTQTDGTIVRTEAVTVNSVLKK